MLNNDELQRLYKYAYSLSKDESVAYDLLYDVIAKVIVRKPPPETPFTFCLRSIRNKFIDQMRREQKFQTSEFDESTNAPISLNALDIEGLAILKNDFPRIWEAVESIDREILYLWAVEEYSTAEISEAIDIPRNTILSRIHRLRNRLKEMFPDQTEVS